MKKVIALLLVVFGFSIFGSVKLQVQAADYVLRVYNWQDYIDEGKDENGNPRKDEFGNPVSSVIDDFEEYYYQKTGKTVEVIYTTYETNEVMLNSLKTGNIKYDLVCPSDYVIQKMVREDMLEEIDMSLLPNYQQYASPYLIDIFEKYGWDKYAVNYMWGTLGFLYNAEEVDDEDVTSWTVLWDENYKNRVTIKDSVRDTYIIGVCYVYKDELDELADWYDANLINESEYSEAVTEIINRRDDETLAKVEEALKALKKNIAGFEVDSGKNDIRTGKIDINFAWSGDAIYSIQTAWEESELELKYQIPYEGSNIWFDAWVMPKGANKELAHEFLNYLCDPEVAARNMEFIGYTSAIAGDAMLDLVNDWYGVEDGDLTVDLSYFFAGTVSEGKSMIIETDSDNDNLLLAQYPTKEIIARCGIMEDFGDQNEKLLAMWQRVKANIVPVWIYFVAGGIAVGIVSVIVINRQSKQMRIKRQKAKVGKK